jgi:hypothetical protein
LFALNVRNRIGYTKLMNTLYVFGKMVSLERSIESLFRRSISSGAIIHSRDKNLHEVYVSIHSNYHLRLGV